MSSRPTFILFKPQLGENIGAVARAMSNFGLADLRIVAPRDGWPNEAAEAMAAGGLSIIQQAEMFDTLAEALHDITHLYATSARERAMDKPVFTPKAWAENFVLGQEARQVGRAPVPRSSKSEGGSHQPPKAHPMEHSVEFPGDNNKVCLLYTSPSPRDRG